MSDDQLRLHRDCGKWLKMQETVLQCGLPQRFAESLVLLTWKTYQTGVEVKQLSSPTLLDLTFNPNSQYMPAVVCVYDDLNMIKAMQLLATSKKRFLGRFPRYQADLRDNNGPGLYGVLVSELLKTNRNQLWSFSDLLTQQVPEDLSQETWIKLVQLEPQEIIIPALPHMVMLVSQRQEQLQRQEEQLHYNRQRSLLFSRRPMQLQQRQQQNWDSDDVIIIE
jgi:hypothetical protein